MYLVGILHGVILPCLQSLSIPGQTQSVKKNIAVHCSELNSRMWAATNWFGDVNGDSIVVVFL